MWVMLRDAYALVCGRSFKYVNNVQRCVASLSFSQFDLIFLLGPTITEALIWTETNSKSPRGVLDLLQKKNPSKVKADRQRRDTIVVCDVRSH